MGVPTFFKWLTMRNPKIVIDCYEPQSPLEPSGNPTIDNLYIDMNGLIHPSCNPQPEHNIRVPSNFTEQCENIFIYVDKLMNIVRPQKLLYLAIDGVAPRAKLNQQRSRRFRAARESQMNDERKKQLLEKYQKNGNVTQEIVDYVNKKSFDSNVITPGTEFLSQVSQALHFYIKDRLNTHSLWKDLVVILSDANCPGEGEHKIMEFIRQQRACEGYQPNLSHCLYGADADLIMLGLMTHQPQFYIIRQTIVLADHKRCTLCNRTGHFFMNCPGKDMQAEACSTVNVNFQLIRLQLAREQLALVFKPVIIPFGFDLERIVDDFVFMCFFVGNDFLPHIPSLSIRDGGIDILMFIYECALSKMSDYLIHAGIINYRSLQIFLGELSKVQDKIVQQSIKREFNMKQRDRQFSQKSQASQPTQAIQTALDEFKNQLKQAQPSDELDVEDYSVFNHPLYSPKEKFYTEKFRIEPCDFMEFRAKITQAYIEALTWICLYYYKGVPCWSWFYPFHYSPFITDIRIELYKYRQFEKGKPFKPFQQLIAVFPPKTSWAVPTCLQHLIVDRQSPLADCFPSDFVIDTVGKKFAWLGEVLLPFIDQSRLLSAMGDYETKLTAAQKSRNRLGNSVLFYHVSNPIKKYVTKDAHLTSSHTGIEAQVVEQPQLPTSISSPFDNSWPPLQNNRVECVPIIQPSGKQHSIRLKPGTRIPQLQIDANYIQKTDKRSYNGQKMIRLLESIVERPRREFEVRRQSSTFEVKDSRPDYRAQMERKYRDMDNSREKINVDRREERRDDRRDDRRDERRDYNRDDRRNIEDRRIENNRRNEPSEQYNRRGSRSRSRDRKHRHRN